MYESCLHQYGQVFLLAVQKLFEQVHAFHHFLRWWRDKWRVTRPCASDPVLGLTEFTWMLPAAALFGQENLVNFSYQPQRERKILAESAKPMIHRCYIV